MRLFLFFKSPPAVKVVNKCNCGIENMHCIINASWHLATSWQLTILKKTLINPSTQ